MRRRWAWLLPLALAAALLEMVGVGFVFALVSAISDTRLLARVPLAGEYLVEMGSRNPGTAVTAMGIAVILFFLLKNAFLLYQIYNQEKVTYDTTNRVATELLRRYLNAPYLFLLRRNSAHLLQRLEQNVDDAYRMAMLSALGLISDALVTVGLVLVLVAAEPMISLVIGFALGGILGLTTLATSQRFAHIGSKIQATSSVLFQTVQQSLGSAKEVKLLGREEHFVGLYGRTHLARTQLQRQGSLIQQTPRLLMETLMVAGMVLVVLMVLATHGDQATVLPTLSLFAYVGFRLQPQMNRIFIQISNVRRGSAAAAGLIDEWRELQGGKGTALRTEPLPLPFEHGVELKGVTFSYPDRAAPVLAGLDLAIRRGTSLGVAGSTGAGKSTLIDILLGLLTPQSGAVLVDGTDIAIDPRAWQRRVGYVPQSIYLTDDTLRRNIALGVADEEIDEDRIERAVTMARLDEVVAHLPRGLDTVLGERGVRFSGGQRQRVGVARALYHEPELLVFDEATSALDAETEYEVSRAIESLGATKTIVLIAHRLSTLRNCSEIAFLKEGRVAALGPFERLLETDSDFRRMAELSGVAA